jgi:hypothetical protein
MALLKKGVALPVVGIDFSKPATFIDDRGGFPNNVRYFRSELSKRPGKTAYGSAMADGIRSMGILDLNTVKYLLRVSNTNVEKFLTGNNTWEDITGTPFTGGVANLFFLTNVVENALLVITNGYDKIRKWTGSGDTTLLGGNPPRAKYMTYQTPYLILAYTDDGVAVQPWNVSWCDTGNPEEWVSGNSGSQLLSSEPSIIMNIINQGPFVIVYKEQSIWLGTQVGPPDIWLFTCQATGIGLASPKAVVDAESVHYFMGFNDFFTFSYGATPTSIGGPVRDQVFSRIDRDKMDQNFAIHVQNLNEIWFFVTVSGQEFPTEVYKYNYRLGYWYQDSCLDTTASTVWKRVTTTDWDNFPGVWDAALLNWDATSQTKGFEEVVFGDAVGNTMYLDYNTTNDLGITQSSSFATKDFTGDDMMSLKRWVQIDTWAKGPGTLYVDYSIDEGLTWVNIPHTSTSASIPLTFEYGTHRCYFDVVSDKIRFRYRNSENNEIFYIRNFCPYYIMREAINR